MKHKLGLFCPGYLGRGIAIALFLCFGIFQALADKPAKYDPEPDDRKGQSDDKKNKDKDDDKDKDKDNDDKDKDDRQKESKPLPPVITPGPPPGPVPGGTVGTLPPTNTPVPAFRKPVDLRLLVLTGDGTEPSFVAIKTFLDQIGIPYTTVIAKSQPLPALTNGVNGPGLYQGIILATGNLAVCDPTCRSALPVTGWAALDAYTRDYGVRLLSYYTFPESRYGISFTGVAVGTTDAAPAMVSLTSAASSVFPDLKPALAVTVANAYTYVAAPFPAAGEVTTPIMTALGGIVGVITKKADGREYLALTMDNNYFLMHSLILKYGLINWVTRGVFLGARKAYFTPQIDDIFIPADLFDQTIAACRPSAFIGDPASQSVCPRQLRISGLDMLGVEMFQMSLRAQPQFANFKVYMAFNAFGTTRAGNAPANDSLADYARYRRVNGDSPFGWLSHTYDHENLDCFLPVAGRPCVPATFAQSSDEITKNTAIATQLGLRNEFTAMVTPDVSGLNNPNFLRAAAVQGIKYLVADTSRLQLQGTLPPPNTGIRSSEPSILLVPRRPTNIFYNVSTARVTAVGSEPDEYNYFYAPGGISPSFPRQQTYADIIGRESDNILRNMLAYSAYPVMFHQTNLWLYDGLHSAFTDLVDATYKKFAAISTIPVLSPSQTDIGKLLESRMSYNSSNVRVTLSPGVSMTFTALSAARIPITGVCTTGCEAYGGQRISYVDVPAGRTLTVLPPF
jgi:hypothetical protein